jgi:hypothetical protein
MFEAMEAVLPREKQKSIFGVSATMPETVFKRIGGEKEAIERGYSTNYSGYDCVTLWKNE